MATRRYSITGGDAEFGGTGGITEAVGAATVTKAMEFTVDLANVLQGATVALNKQQVLEGLEKIRKYLVRGSWPPA